MASEIEVLQELGLSANEAKLYLILVKMGQMKANELSAKSGIERRTVYDTMRQLEKKGVVGKAEVSGVLVFTPAPPSSLLSFLEEKRDSIERILPSLSRPFEGSGKATVSVLHGKAGIKMVLEDVLALKSGFSVYSGSLGIQDYLPRFFSIFDEKRKRLRIKARYLLADVPQNRERVQGMAAAEFRFLDPSVLSPGVWWTYADRLVLFVLQDEPVTIFIKNAELSGTFQKTFNSLFSSNSRVYHGIEGIQAILGQTLKYEETLFIGGSGQVAVMLPDYMKEYSKLAASKKHKWFDVAQRSIKKTGALSLPFHSCRFLPQSMASNPNVIWIFGDCVANVVWLPEPIAFIVENTHVAKAYKSYFWLLWKIAEKN